MPPLLCRLSPANTLFVSNPYGQYMHAASYLLAWLHQCVFYPCCPGCVVSDKVEVVNRLRKSHVLDTIRNYTINYDTTWIFDKIQ